MLISYLKQSYYLYIYICLYIFTCTHLNVQYCKNLIYLLQLRPPELQVQGRL